MNFETNIVLDETFERLSDRNVKDLYWLLFSKCPVNNNHPVLETIPFFSEDILENWRLSSIDYFLKLDQRPDELRHFLDRPKNKRLGFYAEALLSFFFQTFSEIELLLQNHQIIDEKRTLGELDFIIKWKDRVIHIECAVKFYLCDHSRDVNDLHSWIGPACKDDLGKKIKKVKDQQLPMISSSKLSDMLNRDEVESFLFLKGKMFVNREVSCNWVNDELLGKYFSVNEVVANNEMYLLNKPYWMSVMTENSRSKQSTCFREKDLRKRAELVMTTGSNPFFLVPKNWPF